jgi:2-polyprenyl-3-methyl-5-hydroxy-6-metoxy-1,4-benzoquinol methylase
VQIRELIMGVPWVYRTFQSGISKEGSREWFVRDVIKAERGMRVLDIGCGPADIYSRLGEVSYLGIDHNAKYIKQAQARFGHSARFECWDVTDHRLTEQGQFDVVLLLGVLHHLTDDAIAVMLSHAVRTLRPGGRLITHDPAIEDSQHPIAKLLAKIDRGRHVRSLASYLNLLSPHFTPAEVFLRHDLLRVPYTNSIITAIPIPRAA